MNVVQNHWQPRVIRIGFPLTTKTNQDGMDSNRFSRSFPILAVTRSKTMPYVTVSEAIGPRKQTFRLKPSSSHGYSREKLARSSSVSHRSTNGDATSKNDVSESDQQNSETPRTSSLPVWPVTNLSTITKMAENSTKVLPKPKLNLEWSGWKRPRRTSFQSGSSREARSANSQRPNTTKSAQDENPKIMVRVKPPPRSCTPMSEYDPDKLNIKQVVKFLDTQDEGRPKPRSRSNCQVSISRPRPFTVAHTDGKHVGRGVVSAQSERNTGISSRRSPIAARRYMRSAKIREAKDRSLSVSPLGMTDKGRRNRKDWRYSKKMDTLASIAARYNPKADDAKPVEKDPESRKEESLLSYRETTNSSPEQYFGKLKFQSATFQSFPTNKVDNAITEKVVNGRADDKVETNENTVHHNKDYDDTGNQNSLTELADVNLSAFNAVNAIRLPSVFDNVDGESECGWTSGIVPLTKQFEGFGVYGQTDQDQEVSNSECTSRSTSRPTSREKNRHSRNLSLVLAREKSTERSFSPDRKIKFRQTGNWVKNCFRDHKGKIIELKLTHGSPPS
ncbi:uncharacterized protein LOC135461285 [Liolophura sinensis]|uniref:uncharacterized protein LOC135461285 n=1 Tax=Liolophura sinensis TaxID=3198878 RepID=UPI00315867D0